MSLKSQLPLRNLIRNPDCKLCPLHEEAQSVCLIGQGPYPAKLMLVGEAPGHREDDINKPFQGRAGKVLDNVLEVLGIRREETFITNAVHCRPPGNRDPKRNELEVCTSTYLTKEIEYVKPDIIVALGRFSAMGLLSLRSGSIASLRHKLHKTEKGIPVIVTYHPAASLRPGRSDHLLSALVEDFEWVKRILDGKESIGEVKFDYKRALSADISRTYHSGWLSVDLETDGFDPFLPNREIISAQFCNQEGVSRYLRWANNSVLHDRMSRLLHNSKLIGQNLKFDLKWFKAAGIDLINSSVKIFDTMIAAHLIDENQSKSLEDLAARYTPLKNLKQENTSYVKKNKCSFREIPLSIAIPYGCGDTDAAWRLAKRFAPQLKKDKLVPLFKTQMKAVKVVAQMEYDGCKIDTRLIDQLANDYENRIASMECRIKHLTERELNVKSPKQIATLLYHEWKLPAMGTPKYWNQPLKKDTAEDTLRKLLTLDLKKRQRKVIELVLQGREMYTIYNRYVLGLSDFLRKGDFIHPSFKLHGTVTGRWSCVDPNLQQIPREGDVKRLFVSRFGSKGVIFRLDVSQAELRFFTHLSQEPTMLSYFRSGSVDIHRKTAAAVLKKREEEVTEQERKKAKTFNFGLLYMQSVQGMAAKAGITLKEAQKFYNDYHEEFSGWNDYIRKSKRFVIKHGYVRNLFGRIRHLPISDLDSPSGREMIRQAVNSPIQGGVGDYVTHCLVNSFYEVQERKIPNTVFMIQVHDEVVIDTVESNIPVLNEIMRRNFMHPDLSEYGIKMTVPIEVGTSYGPNWKEQKEITC